MAEHPNAPRCRHVRTNGIRCGSPAMRNHKLCYYHKKTSGPLPMPKACLPNLEDGNALQLAIAQLARQVIQGGIEYRAAHIMADLYRLALRNFKNMDHSVVSHRDQVTVDEDMDNLNNTHTTEPITYKEEQEMMEEGTLPTREQIDSQIHAPSLSPSFGDRVESATGRTDASNQVPPAEQGKQSEAAANNGLHGKRETGNGKRIEDRSEAAANNGLNGKRETGNPQRSFEDLSEEEQEAYIMRASGNKAYFMKEEDMRKRPPEPDDNLSLEEVIKEAFAS